MKLKDGIRAFEDEDDILNELKSLKGDSESINQDFKRLEAMRAQIGNKDRQLRDTLAKYKSGKL